MKKKTVLIISIILSVIALALYLAVCGIYSLFDNENKTYILGLVILPLLPFILLFSVLPAPHYKLKNPHENDTPDLNKEGQDDEQE